MAFSKGSVKCFSETSIMVVLQQNSHLENSSREEKEHCNNPNSQTVDSQALNHARPVFALVFYLFDPWKCLLQESEYFATNKISVYLRMT